MPMAKPRRSAGKTWKNVTMTSGWMIPDAIPCITRPKTMVVNSALDAQIKLPVANRISVAQNPVRWPTSATT